MTYNLSNIMTRAWKGFRTQISNGKTANFANSLKWSWKLAKEEAAGVLIEAGNIVKETAKAVLVKCWCVNTDGQITFWAPKSLMNNDTLPAWFANKKIEEATNGVRSLSSVTFN